MDSEIDILKKKSLIEYLINNDIPVFKKYIVPISNFNNTEIENIFHGIIGVQYTSINPKDIYFRKLLDKFNNFSDLLENWFIDTEKRCYLKELWKKNQCLESLKMLKSTEEIKQKIPFMNYWPQEIQKEFFDIITQEGMIKDTRAFKMKDFFETQEGKEAKEIVELARQSKESFKNIQIPEEERERLSKVSDILNDNILKGLPALTLVEKNFVNIAFEYTMERNIERLMRRKEQFEKLYKMPFDKNKITDFAKPKDIILNCKRFLRNHHVSYANALLSFLNLGYSIYEFYNIEKHINAIGSFRQRLDEIKENFKLHCIPNICLGEDIATSKIKINNAKTDIKNDQRRLYELILEIEREIKYLEIQERNSKISLGISVASGILSLGGLISSIGIIPGAMTNIARAINGGTTLVNLGTGIIDYNNIKKAQKGIQELKNLLNEAKEEEKKIEAELDKLEDQAKSLAQFINDSKFNY